jgi:hypothetical protein
LELEDDMEYRRIKTQQVELDVRVLPDMRSDIDLHGSELLKMDLVLQQPEAQVLCTAGMLWLTQQGDQQDHLLKAGQTYVIRHSGTVLVQGLPAGKARILTPQSTVA